MDYPSNRFIIMLFDLSGRSNKLHCVGIYMQKFAYAQRKKIPFQVIIAKEKLVQSKLYLTSYLIGEVYLRCVPFA